MWKYNYKNFRLDIIEVCDPSIIIEREQFYLDNLSLKYNTLKIAKSLLGFKHSDKTKENFRLNRLGKAFVGSNLFSNSRSKCLILQNCLTNEIFY